jgi:hypothetical protein
MGFFYPKNLLANLKRLLISQKTSKYKQPDDFYKAMDNLAEKLALAGFSEEANKIHSLMHEAVWTTSAELIGELGLAMKGMRRRYPTEISKEITECLAFAIHHRKILGLGG